jgi:hypothetical protein
MVERTTTLYYCVYTGILPRPTLCTQSTDWVCTGSEQAAFGLDAQMMRGVWWRRDEPGSALVASVSTSTSSAWLFTKASCLPLLTCALSKQHSQLPVSQYYTHYPAFRIHRNQQDAPNLQHALFARPDGVADSEPAPSVVLDKERPFLRKGQHRYVMQPISTHHMPSVCLLSGFGYLRQPHVSVRAFAFPAPQRVAQLDMRQ